MLNFACVRGGNDSAIMHMDMAIAKRATEER